MFRRRTTLTTIGKMICGSLPRTGFITEIKFLSVAGEETKGELIRQEKLSKISIVGWKLIQKITSPKHYNWQKSVVKSYVKRNPSMKKKTTKVTQFLENLHTFITDNPQFRKHTKGKSETQIQAEIRPLIIRYLEKHFEETGYKDYIAKANKSFYWEGQEGQYGKERGTTFGARNYPDFIVTDPYLLAIEYKQSQNGSTVKHAIGQSVMHTMADDFHYVYLLFHDESKDKRIEKSISNKQEKAIIEKMWSDFNVFIRFVSVCQLYYAHLQPFTPDTANTVLKNY